MSRLHALPLHLWQRLQELSGKRMVLSAPSGDHVFSVNLGGESVTVQGQRWMSFDEALAAGLTAAGANCLRTRVVPRPYAERGLRVALNSVVCRSRTLDIDVPLPAGRLELWLWFMENYRSGWHRLALSINGQPVARELGKLPQYQWGRWGPYAVTSDGAAPVHLTLDSESTAVDAHVMALSVYRR